MMRLEPWDSITANISPTEFEKIVKNHLEKTGKKLQSFKASHNEELNAADGSYKIDVTAEFEAFGVRIRVLVECKHHKNPIKREVVQLLYDKIQSIGAHKGIIFATVGFQKGAIKYAKIHGIALIRIVEGILTYETKAINGHPKPPPWADIPKYIAQLIEGKERNSVLVSNITTGDIEPVNDFLFGS
jgi:restriction system protein